MEKEEFHIENMIYEIRGKEVMLDTDIAKLYQVDTKMVNEAVKNNPNKFPERFCWTITKEEYLFLRSNISTLKNLKFEIYDYDIFLRSQVATLKNDDNRGKHSKYLPKVFTEQVLYMLATILKSKVATNVSIVPSGLVNVEYGENKDIEIKANTGYKLKSVKVNGIEQTLPLSDDKIKLTNIQEDYTIVVEVEIVQNETNTDIDIINPKTFDNIIINFILLFISLMSLIIIIVNKNKIHN